MRLILQIFSILFAIYEFDANLIFDGCEICDCRNIEVERVDVLPDEAEVAL